MTERPIFGAVLRHFNPLLGLPAIFIPQILTEMVPLHFTPTTSVTL